MSVRNMPVDWNARLLHAGRRLAGQLRQRIGERPPGEAEHADETGRQRAAVVEEVVDRARDVLLVLIQAAAGSCPSVAVRFKIASVAV